MKELPRNIAVDTSALFSVVTPADQNHQACVQVLKRLPEKTVYFTTEACLTELSWLMPNHDALRGKVADMLRLLDMQYPGIDMNSLERIYQLQDRYADLPMDFADATIVEACERLDVRYVFTLDRKDFSIYRPQHVRALHLLP